MGSTLHPVDHLRERAHLCPIGKVDRIPAVGWAAGYPHNEADDLPVEEAVTGIVDFSRKHSQLPGSPRQALQEFHHVGIGVGMAFFRLPTKGRYFISVKIQRPDAPPPGEARFEFDRY